MTRIDIIIPVYRGVAQTRACIDSVLAAKNQPPSEIVVMNDASPEPEMAAYLADLAANGRITLVTNSANLGFVATCNLAMQMHADRDVVLLNSDTVVPDRWLDRMIACANSAPMTASVTPFSNNATLASYPLIARSNPMPDGISSRELDSLFESANAGRYVEVPTGVGFCMLLTRAAINAVDIFDATSFGRGYGEENDWCMRAISGGFKHYLCGDLFVFHHGEVSFGTDGIAGRLNAQSVIDARYPNYRQTISQHLELDPARQLRRAVDGARLAASPRSKVLFITRSFDAGIDKHIQNLARLTCDSLDILVLKPAATRHLTLTWLRDGEEFESYFEKRDDPGELLKMIHRLGGISRVHLHHVHGLPEFVHHLHFKLGVPLDITLHDFFPVTPTYQLGPGGSIDIVSIGVTSEVGHSDGQWRSSMSSMLMSAERVIVPSHDMARRMRNFIPGVNFQVRPHPELPGKIGEVPFKVLVLGTLSVERGLRLLEACAMDARDRNLPLTFKLLGYTTEPIAKYPEVPLVIGGSYREEDLAELIALERADAFLFLSQSPASYSYTLTAALQTKLPIVASALGAHIERLDANPLARTLPWDTLPAAWNDAVLSAAKLDVTRLPPLKKDVAELDSSREYRNWYVKTAQQAGGRVNLDEDFHAGMWYAPQVRDQRDERSLRQLFDDGVECGHAPTILELRRRVGMADEHIVSAAQEIANAGKRIELLLSQLEELKERFAATQKQLKSERDKVQGDFEAIVASTSWRITAPMRSFISWLRKHGTGTAGPNDH